jgi:energy-coupling factor transporter transmembrane protein EcfT
MRFILIILLILFLFLDFDLNKGALIYMKIILLIEYLNIITYTTSSSELYYAIGSILSMFNLLNFNIDKLTLKIVNTLRFIPKLTNSEYKILKTQASRGIDYNHSDLFGKYYAYNNSLKNIYRVYKYNIKKLNEVSEIRMFNIKRKRTNLRVNYVGFYDFIFLAFHVTLLIGYIFDRGLL